MNIDRITIRRLKSYGNYENVSVELSCPVADSEGWGQTFAELDDLVSLKLAQLMERDRSREIEYREAAEIDDLRERAIALRSDIDAMRNWMQEHREFMQVYESITGKSVDIPF